VQTKNFFHCKIYLCHDCRKLLHCMKTVTVFTLISGFRCDVDEICGLLGYYTASCGNCLPTFRDNVSVPSSCCFNSLFFYSFAFLIFTVGIFVIYLSSFILIFSSFTVTLLHIIFPTVLAICILGAPSSYTLFVSTPLSPWFYPIGCHHITRFATPSYFPEFML
jgi:hypothetical protein